MIYNSAFLCLAQFRLKTGIKVCSRAWNCRGSQESITNQPDAILKKAVGLFGVCKERERC